LLEPSDESSLLLLEHFLGLLELSQLILQLSDARSFLVDLLLFLEEDVFELSHAIAKILLPLVATADV